MSYPWPCDICATPSHRWPAFTGTSTRMALPAPENRVSFLLKMAESLRFEIERAAIRDPDDPAVIAAQDRVRAELAALCCLAGRSVLSSPSLCVV